MCFRTLPCVLGGHWTRRTKFDFFDYNWF